MTCVHPGGILTDIYRQDPILNTLLRRFVKIAAPWMMFDCKQGSLTPLYVALGPDSEITAWNGQFIGDCRPRAPHPILLNDGARVAKHLWDLSVSLLKL